MLKMSSEKFVYRYVLLCACHALNTGIFKRSLGKNSYTCRSTNFLIIIIYMVHFVAAGQILVTEPKLERRKCKPVTEVSLLASMLASFTFFYAFILITLFLSFLAWLVDLIYN